jgi:zinc protease
MGATTDAYATQDAIVVRVRCLAKSLPAVLDLLADIAFHPAFTEAENEKQRSQALGDHTQRKEDLEDLRVDAALSALYPAGHPYRVTALGTEAAARAARATDLRAFHSAHFTPEDLTLSIAGDVRQDRVVADAQRTFGQARAAQRRSNATPARPASHTRAPVVIVDRPRAAQSHVAVATLGVPRASADVPAIEVMNYILGGSIGSRIFMNLCENHGYTYFANSEFFMRKGPGPFLAGGAIQRDATAPTIREILAEYQRMREEPVTSEELAAAQDGLVRALPARFETVDRIAWTFADLSVEGLPLDDYTTRASRYRAVTAADVQRVARALLASNDVRVIIVGDAAVIAGPIGNLGIGPVVVQRDGK